jgi:hypothetical protein
MIEQKAGEATQVMLSSAAFKDAIEQALRGYGLILENPKPIINDDGSATIVDDKDDIDDTHSEDNATGIFQLEFNLEHVTIDEFARRTVKGVSGQYMDVIDPVPAQLDMNEPGETDEYDVTFRPEAGYTIDFIEANYWTGPVENLKAWIKDLIESGKT